ncbi:MAG: helix-turn-helix transcriptional regulator [Clostridia bacterium]|nr:helix-turn-helix transcriptional regulator [Clostridia bacterium]
MEADKYDISNFFPIITEQSVTSGLVARVKQRRKEQHMSQKDIARKSGVSLGSYRRFEQTGEISLQSFLRVADTLGYLADFDSLFKYKRVIDSNGRLIP